MKHTPGPWTVGAHQKIISRGWSIRIPEDGSAIAYVLGEKNPELHANARLIAAAPELLEACKYVVQYHRDHDSGEGELYGLDFVTTCINAIRKAEGENA